MHFHDKNIQQIRNRKKLDKEHVQNKTKQKHNLQLISYLMVKNWLYSP